MKRLKRWLVWLLVLAVLGAIAYSVMQLIGERRNAARAAATAATAPKPPPRLELTEADIVTVMSEPLGRSVAVSGTVQAVRSAFVKAKVAGELVRIEAREGDAVKAGQVLVRQDSTDLDLRLQQAQQQAAAAQAQLEIASRTLANNQALVAQGFISSTALETSVSNEAAARANAQAAALAVDLARRARADATLVAPLSGIVAQRLAQPGERVSVDARILEIVDLSRLEVEVAVPPEDAVGLQVGRPARLQVDGVDGVIEATVARINPRAQAGSRAVLAYLSVQPNPALRQGLFARGAIALPERAAVTLPPSAVRIDRPQPYVLRLQGERIVSQPVRTGERGRTAAGERLEIVEGLQAGDRVVAGTVSGTAEGAMWRSAPGPASPAVARPAGR
jgi:RND family efflux transporter MFP subunit